MSVFSQLLLTFSVVSSVALAAELAFHGPTLPPPHAVSQDADFVQSMKAMTAALHRVLNASSGSSEANSLAVMGWSVSDSDAAFEFYHTGAQVDGATSQVGPDSIFRIASISKLFTVYALLEQGGYDVLGEPITKYVPELKSDGYRDSNNVDWSEVTVGALASYMAGVARDYNHNDLAGQALPFSQLGLPELSEEDIPTCDGNFSQPLCSRQEFLEGIQDRNRIFPPWSSPAYSNAAFRILGYVGEKIANISFDQVLQRYTLEPLNLVNTYTDKPNDDGGIIPSHDSLWPLVHGDDLPSGGIYSSVRDLCTFGRAILNSTQLSSITTRRWMKPVAFIQSLTSAVGMPWEIYRHEFADHAVDLYSKGGGLGQYGSLLVLVPDYNFVFAVLAAGPDTSLSTVAADTVRTHLIRSLQQVSRNQAESQYVGHYSSFQGNNSLSIIMDDQPGLLIDEWISNGVDFLQVMSAYSEGSGSGALQAVRMYPTDLGVNYAAFRLVFISAKSVEHQPGALFAQGMRAWSAVDQIVYGQEAMDEMIFSLGNGTRVTGVESSGLRTRLAKVA